MHGVCTEGIVLPSVGGRSGGNGLHPLHVREAAIAASGRPLCGSGLDSHGLYTLCRADESRLDPCPRKAPAKMADGEAPDPVFWPNLGTRVGGTQPGETAVQKQSRQWEPHLWGRGGVGFGGGGNHGGGSDHRHRRGGDGGGGGGGGASGGGVAQGTAEGVTLVATTGAVTAALAVVKEGGGTARADVHCATGRQPPPAHARSPARTTARWSW